MRRLFLGICLLLLMGCATSLPVPQAQSKQPPNLTEQPIPPDLQAQVDRAQGVGVELYLLDNAAAIATDALRAHLTRPDDAGVRGYLPLREGDDDGRPQDSFLVYFLAGGEPMRIAYRIRVFTSPDKEPQLETVDPPTVVSAELSLLVRARQTAISAVPDIVQPLNPVVLPADDGGILVYLLAGTTRSQVAVFGKHFRVLVDERGDTVKEFLALSKSIIEMPLQPPGGEKPEALWITHLVTEWPLETHVFVSLLHRVPVYVGTSRGLWRVNGNKISFLGT